MNALLPDAAEGLVTVQKGTEGTRHSYVTLCSVIV